MKRKRKKCQSKCRFFSTQSWKLSANQARLTKDQILHLEGNVVAQNLTSDSRLQRIENRISGRQFENTGYDFRNTG